MDSDSKYLYEPYVQKATEKAPLRYEWLQRRRESGWMLIGMIAFLAYIAIAVKYFDSPYLYIPVLIFVIGLAILERRNTKVRSWGCVEFREEAICILNSEEEVLYHLPVNELRSVSMSMVARRGDWPIIETKLLEIELRNGKEYRIECANKPILDAYHEPLHVTHAILRKEIPRGSSAAAPKQQQS